MEKGYFMVPMEYSPNGKGVMAPMEYTPMVYSPNERLFFEVIIIIVKDKKKVV